MRSCREVTQLISDGLDRQLPLAQRVAVRLHVMMCRSCAAYRRQLQALHRALAKARQRGEPPVEATDQSLGEEGRRRLKERLRRAR
jgi:predicted anti-sigma-YlaC factor YlaD